MSTGGAASRPQQRGPVAHTPLSVLDPPALATVPPPPTRAPRVLNDEPFSSSGQLCSFHARLEHRHSSTTDDHRVQPHVGAAPSSRQPMAPLPSAVLGGPTRRHVDAARTPPDPPAAAAAAGGDTAGTDDDWTDDPACPWFNVPLVVRGSVHDLNRRLAELEGRVKSSAEDRGVTRGDLLADEGHRAAASTTAESRSTSPAQSVEAAVAAAVASATEQLRADMLQAVEHETRLALQAQREAHEADTARRDAETRRLIDQARAAASAEVRQSEARAHEHRGAVERDVAHLRGECAGLAAAISAVSSAATTAAQLSAAQAHHDASQPSIGSASPAPPSPSVAELMDVAVIKERLSVAASEIASQSSRMSDALQRIASLESDTAAAVQHATSASDAARAAEARATSAAEAALRSRSMSPPAGAVPTANPSAGLADIERALLPSLKMYASDAAAAAAASVQREIASSLAADLARAEVAHGQRVEASLHQQRAGHDDALARLRRELVARLDAEAADRARSESQMRDDALRTTDKHRVYIKKLLAKTQSLEEAVTAAPPPLAAGYAADGYTDGVRTPATETTPVASRTVGGRRISATPSSVSPLPGGGGGGETLADHDAHVAALIDRALGDVAMMFTTGAGDTNGAAMANGRFGCNRLAHELRHMVSSRGNAALQCAEDALSVAEHARSDARAHRQKLESLQDAFASATADAEDRSRSSASQVASEVARLRAELAERTESIDHAVGEVKHALAKTAGDLSRSQSQLAGALGRVDDLESMAGAAHREAKRATSALAAATDAVDDLRGSVSARIAAVERVAASIAAEFEAHRNSAAESASQVLSKVDIAAKNAKKAMSKLDDIRDEVAAVQGRVVQSDKALAAAAERANSAATADELSTMERRVAAAQQQLRGDLLTQVRADVDAAVGRTEKLVLGRVAGCNDDAAGAIEAAEQRMRDDVDRKLSASSNRISSVVDELTDELRSLRASRSAHPPSSANQSLQEVDAAGAASGQSVLPQVMALESELRLVIQELQLRVDRRTSKLSSEVDEVSETCASLQRSVDRLLRDRTREPSPSCHPSANEIAATVADEVESALARRVTALLPSSTPQRSGSSPTDAFTRGLQTAIETATTTHADELRRELAQTLDEGMRTRQNEQAAAAGGAGSTTDGDDGASRQLRGAMEDLLSDAKSELQAATGQHLQALADTMHVSSQAPPPTGPSSSSSSTGGGLEAKALEIALSQLLTSPPPSVRNAMMAEMRRVAEATTNPSTSAAAAAHDTRDDLVAEVCASETLAAAVSAAASTALAGEIGDLLDVAQRGGVQHEHSHGESPLETAVTRIVRNVVAECRAADSEHGATEVAEAAKTMAVANAAEVARLAEVVERLESNEPTPASAALDDEVEDLRNALFRHQAEFTERLGELEAASEQHVASRIAAAMDELKAAHTDDQRKQAAAVRDVNRDLVAAKEALTTAATAEIRAAVAAVRHEAVEHDAAWSTALVAVKRRVTQLERVVGPVLGAPPRRQGSAGGSRSLPNGSTASAPGDAVNGSGLRPDDSPTLRSPNQAVGSPQHGGRAAPFGPAGDGNTPDLAERRWPPTTAAAATTVASGLAGGSSLGLHDTDDGSDAQTTNGRDSDGDVAATAMPVTAEDATADHVHGDSIHIARWPAVFTEGLRRVAAEVAREQIVLDKSNNNTNNNAGSGASQLQLSSPTGGSGRFTGAAFDESAAAAIARDECLKAMDELRLEFRDDVSAISADASRHDERLRADLGAEIDEISAKLQGILEDTTLHFRMRLDHFASKDDLAQHRSDLNTSVQQMGQQCADLVESTRATLMRRLASVPGGAVYSGAAAVAASTATSRSASVDAAGAAATTTQRSMSLLHHNPVAREVEF